jgi:hypothetical protein
VWPSYSDFEDTKQIYAAAGGTSCAVVSDAIFEGNKTKSGKCGVRMVCWLCLQTEDKSLTTMVEYDKQYAFAKGLLKLNEFLRNTATTARPAKPSRRVNFCSESKPRPLRAAHRRRGGSPRSVETVRRSLPDGMRLRSVTYNLLSNCVIPFKNKGSIRARRT